jgi:hypothetical protein
VYYIILHTPVVIHANDARLIEKKTTRPRPGVAERTFPISKDTLPVDAMCSLGWGMSSQTSRDRLAGQVEDCHSRQSTLLNGQTTDNVDERMVRQCGTRYRYE